MLGLIKKDFYESFCITKNLVGYVIGILFLLIMAIISRTQYSLLLIICIILPSLSSAPMQYAMEQDEISKFDDILLTFPLSKKEIIQAKFTSCFLLTGIFELIALGFVILYVYGYRSVTLQTGLFGWLAGFFVSLFSLGITSIGFYFLGNKKGNIFYILFVLIIAIGYAISYFNINPLRFLTWSPTVLFFLGALISLSVLALSYWGCVKLYTRKHT